MFKGEAVQMISTMAAMLGGMDYPNHNDKNGLTPDQIDVTPHPKKIPMGCKEFVFSSDEHGHIRIVALNEKSALKKYQNKILNKSI